MAMRPASLGVAMVGKFTRVECLAEFAEMSHKEIFEMIAIFAEISRIKRAEALDRAKAKRDTRRKQ